MYRSFVIVILTVALAACGGAPSTSTKPMPANFDDMDHDQRIAFMKDVVMPKMKAEFVKFDARYASMDCKTCHGKGASDGKFDMPNPEIKVLPGTEEAYMAWIAKEPKDAKYTEFMAKTVEPMMAQMLHLTPFDPKTGAGDFGCNNCHLLDPPHPPKERGHDHHDHDHHDHAPAAGSGSGG